MTNSIIWFNEDGLNSEHPMVRDYPNAVRLYIFDVPYLQQWKITKHRLQFIYESLLEIPGIQIYKGETVPIVRQFIEEYKAKEVVTTETPNHIIKGWQHELQKFTNLVTYPEVYPVEEKSSLRRFSRYWRKHDRAWLTL